MGQEISLFLLDFSDSVPKENSNNGESEGNKRRKCLVCGSVGKKWLSSWKANQAGRRHIYNYHDGEGQLLIITREKTE